MTSRKKLIEHSLPLDAINAASKAEKPLWRGHPSTLHKWWAPRPLAACRAVIFAQLIDDPEGWPEFFPDEEAQDRERRRLHRIIENMVEWPKAAKKDQDRFAKAIEAARFEIARSLAREHGHELPDESDRMSVLDYLQRHGPAVYDPFCGGGSIPLEAQRLGLRAYGSDLNPVAVLVSKALVEFPPKFANLSPVFPKLATDIDLAGQKWAGAEGLAEDVRRYGALVRDKADAEIGRLYPKTRLDDGSEATVIAWLWARTVASPDPAMHGAHVPLVSSFVLSAKKGKEAIVLPVQDAAAPSGWRFEIKKKGVTKDELAEAKSGTKMGRGSKFTCILSGTAIEPKYLKSEGVADRLGTRLMAVVIDGKKGREFLPPTRQHEETAEVDAPDLPEVAVALPGDPRAIWCPLYGLDTFDKLFTNRQLAVLKTFSDLIAEVREMVLEAAQANKDLSARDDTRRLNEGGEGAEAYADAVATYLGLSVSKLTMFLTTQSRWRPGESKTAPAFGRHALPMVWDFAETNPFAGAGGDFYSIVCGGVGFLNKMPIGKGQISQKIAQENSFPENTVVSTDPPYYDNVGYADLSDYFYVWLRRTLRSVHGDIFRRIVSPKTPELIVAPYRHKSQSEANDFFIGGMGSVIAGIRKATANYPSAIYYAFKQSEACLLYTSPSPRD